MTKKEIKKKIFVTMNSQISVAMGYGMKRDFEMVALAYYRLTAMVDILETLGIIKKEKNKEYKKLILDLVYNDNL